MLQKVEVRVVENEVCSEWYASQGKSTRLGPRQMCAGYEEGGRDSCWVSEGHGDDDVERNTRYTF